MKDLSKVLTYQLRVSLRPIDAEKFTYNKQWVKSFYGLEASQLFGLQTTDEFQLSVEISDCQSNLALTLGHKQGFVLDINTLELRFETEKHLLRRVVGL